MSDASSEEHVIDTSSLRYFPNVQKVVIYDALITEQNIEDLHIKGIFQIQFNHCAFVREQALSNLDSLESLKLIQSCNNNYSFLRNLNHLQELIITKPYTDASIDLSDIREMKDLQKLTLQECVLNNFDVITCCKKLEKLNVLWSDLPPEVGDYLKQLVYLRELYTTDEYNIDGLNSDVLVRNDLRTLAFEMTDVKKKH